MKNKTAVCVVLALLFSASVSHARWGLEATGSSWKMDGKDLNTTKATYIRSVANANTGLIGFSGSIKQDSVGGSAAFFKEGNSRFRLGFSAGFGMMPTVSAKIHKIQAGTYNDTSLETLTIYVPVDLYFKLVSKGGGGSFYAGGGADFVQVKNSYKYTNSAGTTNEDAVFRQKKMLPHAQAGFEFFLVKWLSVGVSAKYVFSGVLDNMVGDFKSNGVSQGKRKLAMLNDGGGVNGVKLGTRSTSYVYSGKERPYQYDYSGLRANVGLRIYFH